MLQLARRGLAFAAVQGARCGMALAAARGGTVYAVSSGSGRAGVAVLRISGQGAHGALAALLAPTAALPPPRLAATRVLHEPGSGALLDHSLVLRFDAPASFTGEDVVELHVHGGTAVVASVLGALGRLPGLRPATAGEFTRRAFANDKLDLTQVEGLADLIAAETRAQQEHALRHMCALLACGRPRRHNSSPIGDAGAVFSRWRTTLIRIVAHVEAFLDFGEDEGIEADTVQAALVQVTELRASMERHLADGHGGERLRAGVRVALAGPPDVGKSSLLNFLCREERAIVAAGPGTTRDVLSVDADLGGYPVVFLDTAGIRFGDDVGDVEREGVRRAQNAAAGADVRVCVQDGSRPADAMCTLLGGKRACDCAAVAHSQVVLPVVNKADLASVSTLAAAEGRRLAATPPGTGEAPVTQIISCATRDGLSAFVTALGDHVAALCQQHTAEGPAISRARHRTHLAACVDSLVRAEVAGEDDVVVLAEELREAVRELGCITGEVGFEEILDVVFGDFCIGK